MTAFLDDADYKCVAFSSDERREAFLSLAKELRTLDPSLVDEVKSAVINFDNLLYCEALIDAAINKHHIWFGQAYYTRSAAVGKETIGDLNNKPFSNYFTKEMVARIISQATWSVRHQNSFAVQESFRKQKLEFMNKKIDFGELEPEPHIYEGAW